MAIKGDGVTAVATMWALTAISLVFVILRSYTRIVVVSSYGIDDHVYNFAFLFLLLYTIFTTISARYGFGQNMWDIPNEDDQVNAILNEGIGQTFAVLGMAIAKWSLGLFILRIDNQPWQRLCIWLAMGILMGTSISVCFVFWLQCTPPAYLWDRRIEGGFCQVNAAPVSLLLSIICILVDVFFAIFPWFLIWGLQMNRQEKILILASMSLGVIASACGIKRSFQVDGLSSPNYLKDTVGLIVWSAAEIAVTMICIGIPVCRPLYKSYIDRLTSHISSGYKRQDEEGLAMHTIGGSAMKAPHKQDQEGGPSTVLPYITGFSKPSTRSYATATGGNKEERSDQSEENLLGLPVRVQQDEQSKQIRVTEEYQVTRS